MNREAFEEARTLIMATGCIIEEAEYNPKVFGSWYIIVSSKPRCRLVWDGKEESLMVERVTDKLFNGLPLWDEVWISNKPSRNDFLKRVQELINEGKR